MEKKRTASQHECISS